MDARTQRAIKFGVGLMIGFALFDWFFSQSFEIVKLVFGGIAGGIVYWFILKAQGR